MTSQPPAPVPAGSHTRLRLPEGTERVDLVLRLLDHQVVGPEGELLGNVDDLVLGSLDGRWHVTAFAVGPGALSERLPGLLGDWLGAVWRRLHPDPDPQPVVVPIEHVTRIGSAIEVDAEAARALAGVQGLELWLRRYLTGRLPGATDGGDERDENRVDSDSRTGEPPHRTGPAAAGEPGWRPAPDAVLASAVLGREVFSADGRRLGQVVELHGAGRPAGAHQVPIEVVAVQVGPHGRGTQLGYTDDPRQGPAIVGALVRRWQRANRVVPVEGVAGWPRDRLVVADADRTVHPHIAW
jgi:sporulation protein YlmC with PRC-barrel domain